MNRETCVRLYSKIEKLIEKVLIKDSKMFNKHKKSGDSNEEALLKMIFAEDSEQKLLEAQIGELCELLLEKAPKDLLHEWGLE